MAVQSKTPVTRETGAVDASRSKSAEIDSFLAKVKTMTPAVSGRGRLIFAMDATMSRQPTWDLALKLQADMFHTVKQAGGLDASSFISAVSTRRAPASGSAILTRSRG